MRMLQLQCFSEIRIQGFRNGNKFQWNHYYYKSWKKGISDGGSKGVPFKQCLPPLKDQLWINICPCGEASWSATGMRNAAHGRPWHDLIPFTWLWSTIFTLYRYSTIETRSPRIPSIHKVFFTWNVLSLTIFCHPLGLNSKKRNEKGTTNLDYV